MHFYSVLHMFKRMAFDQPILIFFNVVNYIMQERSNHPPSWLHLPTEPLTLYYLDWLSLKGDPHKSEGWEREYEGFYLFSEMEQGDGISWAIQSEDWMPWSPWDKQVPVIELVPFETVAVWVGGLLVLPLSPILFLSFSPSPPSRVDLVIWWP